jgi:ElaA protein
MAASGETLADLRRPVTAWRFARFEELTARELHDAFQLRSAVFVVEQTCPFLDLDGADPLCWHLLGFAPSFGTDHNSKPDVVCPPKLVAYCRLVPPGVKYPEPSIGRVVSAREARRTGAGRALMAEAVARAEALWPGQRLRIGAQMYLKAFYEGFGFRQSSQPYDEDGILHIEMIREAK